MVDKVKKVWMDGRFVDWDDASVHILTHSLHYGLAAFEGIRAYKRADGGTYIFRAREHVDRLFDSCKMCLLKPEFTREQIIGACAETLRVNGMPEGYLRPMVFVGEGAMGIYAPTNPVRSAVIAWKWGAYLGEEALKSGIRAKISSFARHHINISLAKAKMTGQYTNSVLAKREAKLGGYDEAILLDSSGYVSEGSGENIFVVRKGVLYTPDLSCSILEGITRDTILTLARELGITVVETPHHPRPALAGRRSLLHGHRGRGHAGARDRQPHRRRRHRGAAHQAPPGEVLRRRARQRHVPRRVAHEGLTAAVLAPACIVAAAAAAAVPSALLGCGPAPAPVVALATPPRPPAVAFPDDPAPLPRFHSQRLALYLPLPDGKAWRIDDHSRPELVATHAPTQSTVRVAVFRTEGLVGRHECEALARDRRLVPPASFTPSRTRSTSRRTTTTRASGWPSSQAPRRAARSWVT